MLGFLFSGGGVGWQRSQAAVGSGQRLQASRPCGTDTASALFVGAVVGIIANMPARLITRFKNITPDGGVIELVVWRVPAPVPPTGHGYKYRAVYALNGERIVGFDNARGKGDHCHLDGVEMPYHFVSVEQLVEDFIAAVTSRRSS